MDARGVTGAAPLIPAPLRWAVGIQTLAMVLMGTSGVVGVATFALAQTIDAYAKRPLALGAMLHVLHGCLLGFAAGLAVLLAPAPIAIGLCLWWRRRLPASAEMGSSLSLLILETVLTAVLVLVMPVGVDLIRHPEHVAHAN